MKKKTQRPDRPKGTAPRKGSGEKAAAAKKPRRLSALDAAVEVLKKTGQPMGSQEMIAAMAKQGLWKSPGGKTPHATLYSAILREIVVRGNAARFRKVDRGQFALAGKKT